MSFEDWDVRLDLPRVQIVTKVLAAAVPELCALRKSTFSHTITSTAGTEYI